MGGDQVHLNPISSRCSMTKSNSKHGKVLVDRVCVSIEYRLAGAYYVGYNHRGPHG